LRLLCRRRADDARAPHLRGGDKEGARQYALLLFPSAHALLARRKDHGRAEAALIALSATSIVKVSEAESATLEGAQLQPDSQEVMS